MPEWSVKTKEYQLTKEQYLSLSWKLSRPGFWSFYLACVGIAFYGMVMRPTFGGVFAFICMIPISYLIATLAVRSTSKSFAKHPENQGFFDTMVIELDNSQLQIIEGEGKHIIPWSRIRTHLIYGEDIALFLNRVSFWYLPRTAFESEGDWTRVKDFVTASIPVRKG